MKASDITFYLMMYRKLLDNLLELTNENCQLISIITVLREQVELVYNDLRQFISLDDTAREKLGIIQERYAPHAGHLKHIADELNTTSHYLKRHHEHVKNRMNTLNNFKNLIVKERHTLTSLSDDQLSPELAKHINIPIHEIVAAMKSTLKEVLELQHYIQQLQKGIFSHQLPKLKPIPVVIDYLQDYFERLESMLEMEAKQCLNTVKGMFKIRENLKNDCLQKMEEHKELVQAMELEQQMEYDQQHQSGFYPQPQILPHDSGSKKDE